MHQFELVSNFKPSGDQPEAINAIYDQSIVVGQEEFVVDVGIDGALVAISSNNQLLSQAYSIGGVAILDISDASTQPGELDLVITSFNSYFLSFCNFFLLASHLSSFFSVFFCLKYECCIVSPKFSAKTEIFFNPGLRGLRLSGLLAGNNGIQALGGNLITWSVLRLF